MLPSVSQLVQATLRLLHTHTPLPVKHRWYALGYIMVAWKLYYLKYAVAKPVLYFAQKPEAADKVVPGSETKAPTVASLLPDCPRLTSRFWPFFLATNGLMQTALMEFGFGRSKITYTRQMVPLRDGGTMALDWVDNDSLPPTTPTILVYPGVLGGSHEGYILRFVAAANNRGFRCVVVIRRGCGRLPMTTPHPQNYADKEDMPHIVNIIKALYPGAPLFLMGFSQGANAAVRQLGIEGEDSPFLGGASACNPYDLVGTSYWLKYVNRIIDWKLVSDKKKMLRRNWHLSERAKELFGCDFSRFDRAETYRELAEYERIAWGYRSLNAYFDESSSRWYIRDVRVPLLCISALDDPVCAYHDIPFAEFEDNPYVLLAVTLKGGHHAYIQNNPFGPSWLDSTCLEWFEAILQRQSLHPHTHMMVNAEKAEEDKQRRLVRQQQHEQHAYQLQPTPEQWQAKSEQARRALVYGRWVMLTLLWPLVGYQLFRIARQSNWPKESRYFFLGGSAALLLVGVARALRRLWPSTSTSLY